MNPLEKIKEIRGNLSRPKFAEKFGVKVHTIKDIEDGKQAIPDDLALALEKEYKIPFKWWKTGEGSMFLEETEPTDEEMEEEVIKFFTDKKFKKTTAESFMKLTESEELVQVADLFIEALEKGDKDMMGLVLKLAEKKIDEK